MSAHDSASLRALAGQCRRLAKGASARDVSTALEEMAAEYDHKAQEAAVREAEAADEAP